MNEPWTLPPLDSVAGTQAINAFRAAKVDLPYTTVFTDSDIARIALVAKGRFLTISAEAALRFANSDMAIKVLPIDLPAMHGAVGIITLKNRTLSPVAQLFIDCARQIAKPVPRGESVRHRAGRLKN
jgi:DNA-binding transcriptional LysR family regulator